ncbi:MAG: hypothetical protein V7609_1720 [Verrucomicrobiota bacterium]
MRGTYPLEFRPAVRLTLKNIIVIVVMIALVGVFTFVVDDWLKANLPGLYPYRSMVFGIAVGIATGISGVFNAIPGQREEEADNSTKANLLTFFGAVVFSVLFFGVADMIHEKYPAWFVPFRISVVALLTAAWYQSARRS